MKHLKFFHLLAGLLALIFSLASVTDTLKLSAVPASLSSPMVVILIAAALVNLMAQTCISVRSNRNKRTTIIGSFCLLVGLCGATVAVFDSTLHIADAPLSHSALVALIIGTLFFTYRTYTNGGSLFTVKSNYIRSSAREKGTVKWFNVTKGFGFITRDAGDDIFVHYRAIRGDGHRTLHEGQRVQFVVVEKDKGLQAEDVIGITDRS